MGKIAHKTGHRTLDGRVHGCLVVAVDSVPKRIRSTLMRIGISVCALSGSYEPLFLLTSMCLVWVAHVGYSTASTALEGNF